MKKAAFSIVFFIVLMFGCTRDAFENHIPIEESYFAVETVSKIVGRQYEWVEKFAGSPLRTTDLRQKIDALANTFPTHNLPDAKVIGFKKNTSTKSVIYEFTLEYEYDKSSTLAVVILNRRSNFVDIQGVTLTPNYPPISKMNRFSFERAGFIHYLIITIAVTVPLLVSLAFFRAFQKTTLPNRWLWMAFILTGIGQLDFNWATGEAIISPLSAMLVGAGFTRSGPAAPWIISISAPLGAILFLIRKHGESGKLKTQINSRTRRRDSTII